MAFCIDLLRECQSSVRKAESPTATGISMFELQTSLFTRHHGNGTMTRLCSNMDK
jgi:hypothetical protein